MKSEIETLVANTLRLDPTVRPEAVETALRVLRGEVILPQDAPATVDSLSDLIKRPALARKFGVSPKTVSNWAKRGRLDSVKNQRGQTIGYTLDSVRAIYRGER